MRLHNYQQRIVDKLKSGDNCILSVGMGLGKTISVLTYINEIMPSSVLIVAPKRVAESVWYEEAVKWRLPIADKMVKVMGTPKKRQQAVDDDSKPYKVISRDNLDDICGMRFQVLVLDELTSFKNVMSTRSQAVCRIIADQKIGLTGTFLANGAIDIFGQCCAVGLEFAEIKSPGKRCAYCPQFESWRARWFYDVMKGSGKNFHKWRMLVPLETILKPYIGNIFTLSSADYLDIPKVRYIKHDVQLSKTEMDAYVEFSATCCVSLDDMQVSVKEESKFVKLQTLSNGFLYDSDGTPIRGKGSSKLESVADFCERCVAEGEQVLLFYAFRYEELWLEEMFGKRGITYASVNDTKNIQRWMNREFNVLVAHPASAGHGLNLQGGGHICVWSSVTYNYELWSQANARLARQGQTHNVQIHTFTATDTIEEEQRKALAKKTKDDNDFVNLTKQ